MNLHLLVAEAVALAGGNLCARGHDWQFEGGRPCPRSPDEDDDCSQSVFRCGRCGVYDYGQPGGPGHAECETSCDRFYLAKEQKYLANGAGAPI